MDASCSEKNSDEFSSTATNSETNRIEKQNSDGLDLHQAPDCVDMKECNSCKKWQAKYKDMEKSYLKLSVRYTELMLKHEDLVAVSTGRSNACAESCEEGNHNDLNRMSSERSHSETKVSPTDDVFTEHELKCLQCVPLDKKKDSTFILNCIQFAYKNDAGSLSKKTLKGTRPRYEVKEGEIVTVKSGKDPLTPEKVARIQQLFIDRVTKSKCLSGEFGERVKITNFNQLMANAVKNISYKQAPKDVLSKQNEDLNL